MSELSGSLPFTVTGFSYSLLATALAEPPRSTAIVRQSVAVSFLIEMSLVDFDCEGREPIKDYTPPSQSGSSLSVRAPSWIFLCPIRPLGR